MRHFFCDSLKRFLTVFVATLAFVAPTFAANLPSGYTELEYIESTGTQFIDTGIRGNLDTKLEMDFALLSNNGNTNIGIYGAAGDNQNSSAFVLTTNSGRSYIFPQFDSVSRTTVANLNFVLGKKYHSVQSKDGWYYDGTLGATWSNPTAFTTPRSMILFGSRGGGESGADTLKSSAQVWTVKIWNGSTLVRDFVPAKNSSGVIGMYDTVNDQFYTNAGTGTFTAGPVVTNVCNLFNKNAYNRTQENLYVPSETSTQTNLLTDEMSINVVYMPIKPNTTYTLFQSYSGAQRLRACFTATAPALNVPCQNRKGLGSYNFNPITLTSASDSQYLVIQIGNVPTNSMWDDLVNGLVIQETDTYDSSHTALCPVQQEAIKIATTKYTEDAFAGLMTTLSEAITKVTNIVDTTVQQATEIGVLAETKQDRPDTDCPAGRKCLLIMGADNKPHWYLIQE